MEAAAQTVVDALARALARGVSVDGPGGALLGFSAQHHDVDRARITSILTRQVPPAVAAWQSAHGVGSAVGPVRVPANPALGMDARVGAPIRRGGVLVGQLWVVEKDRPLADDELAAVARAAVELAATFPAPTRADGRRAADVLLASLIDGDEAVLARLQAVLGDVEVCPVAVRATHADRRPGPVAPPAVRWTTPRSPRVVATHRADDALTALVTGTADVAAVFGAVRRAAESTALTTVVGVGPRGPASAVGTGLLRAAFAARAAAADPALPPVVTWESLGPYRYLAPDDDVDPLTPLVAHGEPGAVLLRTLETYLDLAGDAGRTAAALSLHRTTLYYRLGRVEQILAVGLRDGMTRTHLHVALKRRRLGSGPGA